MHERQPKPLTRLNILVHPLSLSGSPICREEDYQKDTSRAYAQTATLLVPNTPNEFLLLMPYKRVNETFAEHKERINKARMRTWMDLFKDLKKGSIFANNIRLTPNVTELGPFFETNLIIERLKKIGKTVNSETEIILGGEFTFWCVEVVAHNLLQVPYINKVSIDRRCSVDNPESVGPTSSGSRTEIRTQGPHIIFSRNKTTT